MGRSSRALHARRAGEHANSAKAAAPRACGTARGWWTATSKMRRRKSPLLRPQSTALVVGDATFVPRRVEACREECGAREQGDSRSSRNNANSRGTDGNISETLVEFSRVRQRSTRSKVLHHASPRSLSPISRHSISPLAPSFAPQTDTPPSVRVLSSRPRRYEG